MITNDNENYNFYLKIKLKITLLDLYLRKLYKTFIKQKKILYY